MTFDEFWQAYPRHLGKHEARKAFAKIPLLLHNELMVGLVAWCGYWEKTRTEAQYIPYPATWLNKRRWEDKPLVVVRQHVGQGPTITRTPEQQAAFWRNMIAKREAQIAAGSKNPQLSQDLRNFRAALAELAGRST